MALGAKSVSLTELLRPIISLEERKTHTTSGGITGTCALMGHRDVFTKIGNYDPSMRRAQDLEFAIRASTLGCHFISVDEVLLDYCWQEQPPRNFRLRWETYCRIARKYKHVVPVHEMTFFHRDECKYLRLVLKNKRDIKAYMQGIWELSKLSPIAGARIFFYHKNILRMLRTPFVNSYIRLFKTKKGL